MSSGRPSPGQLWNTSGTHALGVYLDAGYWNVLHSNNGELGLEQVTGLQPLAVNLVQPAGNHFEGHFNALAAAHGLGTTWAEEVARYQQEGLARIVNR